ncbi:MAG: SIR2 family protein [Candidatus Omnitrophota bacterium]
MENNDLIFLNDESRQYLIDLREKTKYNKVVLFVGAGLSRNAHRKNGAFGKQFPLWADLTKKMLVKLYGENHECIEKDKYDYLNVADKFEAEFGRISLLQLIEDSLEDLEYEPSPIHQLISRFDWEIITTNFDTLIERGFELSNKTPNLILSDPDLSTTEEPRIFKINGCIKSARTQIIITGEDFRAFSDKKPLMELYVKKCFIESTVLFVGFSLDDPAFKMIHGWVRDRLIESRSNRFAYSIQSFVDEPTKKIWTPRGIRFIELYPDNNKHKECTEQRVFEIFDFLYQQQSNLEQKESSSQTKEFISDLMEKLEKYSGQKQLENILLQALKGIITKLEKEREKLFTDKKVIDCINRILNDLQVSKSPEIRNPDIWIMAMYVALQSGVSQKLLPVDFFRTGFSVLREAALKGECKVSKDMHRYWLFSLLLIGPFECAETLLDISRKIRPQKYPWDISEYIHFHLEVFFDDRSKHRDLFYKTLNNFRTSHYTEAFYKFSLLDTFYVELDSKDVFLNRTYQGLSGLFRAEAYRFRDTLSSIRFPVKESYFKSVVQEIFNAADKGRPIMFTGLSSIILSFPKITMEMEDIDALKKTSLGELFLLAVIYDKPAGGKFREKELRDLMTFMIDSGMIDVSYFLRLLLFRIEGAKLKNLILEVDNCVSRYLKGLISFIFCALPSLDKKELLEIKEFIASFIDKVKHSRLRESLIQIFGYILKQLPEENFESILKTIFSLATADSFSSFGLSFLLLPPNQKAIQQSQLRLLMGRSIEKGGTSFDMDFIAFMLNHKREELFPEQDQRSKNMLKDYLDIKIAETRDFSLQRLINLHPFIEKGFIMFDSDMKKNIKLFIGTAFTKFRIYFEWKIFSSRMIPVYKTFGSLFGIDVVHKIIESYSQNDESGEELKEIPFTELPEEMRDNFALFLKEIYVGNHHNDDDLKAIMLIKMKRLISEGLAGGGHPAAFWDHFTPEEQTQLADNMLNLWLPASEQSNIKAIAASGEFLKYKTDEPLMNELTNRVLCGVFYGSVPVKILWCQTVSIHIKEKTEWYIDNKDKLIKSLGVFKTEKDLDLLREFLELAKLLELKDIKEILDYLKDEKNTRFAEIRRTASRLAP